MQGKTVWDAAKQELLNKQRKIDYLQQNIRRLKQKVSSLKLLTKDLFLKNLLIENEVKLLHVSNIGHCEC